MEEIKYLKRVYILIKMIVAIIVVGLNSKSRGGQLSVVKTKGNPSGIEAVPSLIMPGCAGSIPAFPSLLM